jgi:hypothetical protein
MTVGDLFKEWITEHAALRALRDRCGPPVEPRDRHPVDRSLRPKGAEAL